MRTASFALLLFGPEDFKERTNPVPTHASLLASRSICSAQALAFPSSHKALAGPAYFPWKSTFKEALNEN
jgi:hypothetical protein